ncbi:MAG: GNAT family N-acetyltransferase [Dysgonamonadaceae bacterium]|jgi:diamine N-acetyltransferase|nr:GNAT family N-acetyltransferase [Dysgonamonadaceae bacterium]
MLLESENIKLRALEPEDLDLLYRWENDAELWKYGSSLAPYSKYSLREYLKNSVSDLVTAGQLRLMAELKTDNVTIGTIDFYDYDAINMRAGIGILLDAEYRNRGFGKEMLDLMKEYAGKILFLNQLYAHIPQKNSASLRLFASCGFEQTGILKSWIKTSEGFEDVCVMQSKL